MSWIDSFREASLLSGRLPTLDEVRSIIATTAGKEVWVETDYMNGAGQLLNIEQIVACGNQTHKQWVSIGSVYNENGKNYYPGSLVGETYNNYPTWGDKYQIYDNNNVGLNNAEQVAKAISLGGRPATVQEI